MNRVFKAKMAEMIDLHVGKKIGVVVDLGSYDVNGSFKNLIKYPNVYYGVDRVPGPNVKLVMNGDYNIPLPDEFVDLVISGSCMQYVGNPFRLMTDVNRVLRPGGTVILYAPRIEQEGLIGLPEHLCPEGDKGWDCWRILRFGMRTLLEDSGFSVVDVFYYRETTWGVGRKYEHPVI